MHGNFWLVLLFNPKLNKSIVASVNVIIFLYISYLFFPLDFFTSWVTCDITAGRLVSDIFNLSERELWLKEHVQNITSPCLYIQLGGAMKGKKNICSHQIIIRCRVENFFWFWISNYNLSLPLPPLYFFFVFTCEARDFTIKSKNSNLILKTDVDIFRVLLLFVFTELLVSSFF